MKKDIKKTIIITSIITLSIILIINIHILINWYIDSKKTKEQTKNINETITITEVNEENTETVNPPEEKDSDYWYYTKMPITSVDINGLIELNNDTVGFLNVIGTNINYPIVQTTNNNYYLNHSFDKSYNKSGWVFVDYRNDLNSLNTIIYAHNKLDQTMFGSLKNVFNDNWLNNKDNHIIRLSTKNEDMLFQIFSIYKIKKESYYIKVDFNNDYQEWLNEMLKRSLYDFNTTVNTNDRILTLSTCSNKDNRTVVHAKLIKKSVKDA